MAGKSRFGPDLTEAVIDALVVMEELLILEFLISIILLGLAGYIEDITCSREDTNFISHVFCLFYIVIDEMSRFKTTCFTHF